MSRARVALPYLLLLSAGVACSTPDRSSTDSASDDLVAMAAADSSRDSARRVADRQARLRALTATTDDLSSRDSSSEIRVEVDIDARRVRVLTASGDTVAQHDVAVGSPEWPTRPGEWTIGQVVLNPEWIPPTEESWAEDEEGTQPGDPDNPLGHAQIVYDLPRSIHGTNAPASIGKAVSHGSIRVTNEAALSLAELLMQRTGVETPRELIAAAQRDRSTKRVVDLPQLIPIRVF